jgi:hypothetical protein
MLCSSVRTKRIIAILEAKLDQHPDLFPAAQTAAPTASLSHIKAHWVAVFTANCATSA